MSAAIVTKQTKNDETDNDYKTNIYDSKEPEHSEENNTYCMEHIMHSMNSSEFNELGTIKQKELLKHLDDLKYEYDSKIHNLESSLDHITHENDAYCSQITALKQHNEYIREASNQWHTRYNDTKILLLNAKEEILNLKTELTNMQLLYNEQTQIENKQLNKYINNNNNDNDNKQIETVQRYINENKKIKSENIKYLNQLTNITNEYNKTNIKYENITQIQKDLQNELSCAKLKINELDTIIHEYFIEITYLENKNNDLKQSLNEINNTNEIFENEINPISYMPNNNNKTYKRMRSMSKDSLVSFNDSLCNTPIVHHLINGDDNDNYKYLIKNINENTDVYNNINDSTSNISENIMKNKMENLYDLYQAINDYLFQMNENIQNIKTLQLLYKKNPKALDKFRASQSEIDATDSVEDDMKEDFQRILDNNEQQQQLIQMQNTIEQLRDCLSEMHKEQIGIIEDEKMRYNTLDTQYSDYKTHTKRKMQQLTKDVYKTQYKKYDGYRDILRDMIGNAGSYTKDAIIHKLTG